MPTNGMASPARPCRWLLTMGMLVSLITPAPAQNLAPNPSLDSQSNGPGHWTIREGNPEHGGWEKTAERRGVWIRGDGDNAGAWRTAPLPLQPAGLYRLHFRGRRDPQATGGTAVAGTSRVNRDFPLSTQPQDEAFAFIHPSNAGADFMRLGQWHVRGLLRFEQAQLFPAVALHVRSPDGLTELGEAESIRGGVYRFEPDFGWEGANAHRTLVTNNAGFNSNRWLFQPGSEVVYHLGARRRVQMKGALRIGINHHTGGTLAVEAARGDDAAWIELGRFDGQRRTGKIDLPSQLFPIETIRLRLRQADEGSGFQVDTLAYEASLVGDVPDLEGTTQFVEIHESQSNLGLEFASFSTERHTDRVSARVRLDNRSANMRDVRLAVSTEPPTEPPGPFSPVQLAPGINQWMDIAGPNLVGPGNHAVRLTVTTDDGQILAKAVTRCRTGILDDSHYGEWISTTEGLTAWWCDSMRKVGRGRTTPVATLGERPPSVVRLELARGEAEAAQVVLKPTLDSQLLGVTIGTFRDAQGHAIPGLNAQIDEVAYVPVTRPTDGSCLRGEYPDPLPPLKTPLRLNGGENHALWITVRAGRETPAGKARSELELRTDVVTIRVPVEATVFDFELPRETHLRSAFGLGSTEIARYHQLKSREDRVAVFEMYLRNFAEHRISPYSFYDFAPIDIQFVTQPGGTGKVAQIDFKAFDDAAKRWLGPEGFNTFQLPLRGMGGGTFHSRHLGKLEGFEEGTPEHARLFRDYLGQIERHLDEQGWLSKAFTYWFDEPDPKDYEFVVAGMKRLKDAAPHIRRMLTEQPEPALMGHVDIWCGLTPEWTRDAVKARRDAGEEVWWYICTAPKAPYVTEFIDHPGTELRLWPWQSWQYDVTGLLVWASIYWTSPLAYPEPARQDPWRDPMSWVTGYGYPVGHQAPWGNGDGRFLYPPRPPESGNQGSDPVLTGPVNSIRWENLRDGMEDYEYLWLLQQEVTRVSSQPGRQSDPNLADARALLQVPDSISRNLTEFTTVPDPILKQRRRIAEAIVRLRQMR
ncbi:MAG: DUF4091 domain-containing protein [Verrucomicrobiales bacterium]|nr:DUF4091 domain-containing protein [Verrucomicrobiales bacterium]